MLSGEVAAKYAGPSVILSFIVAALIAGLAALSYAELASMMPTAGSTYSYVYASKFLSLARNISRKLFTFVGMGGKICFMIFRVRRQKIFLIFYM